MGLSARDQFRYWGLAALVFVLFLWLMGNTLLPFIVGAAIAYLLDPWADWLEDHGLNRVAATAVITALVVVFFAFALFLLIPLIVGQVQALVATTPEMVAQLQVWMGERFPGLFDEGSQVRQVLASMTESIKSGSVAVVQKILTSSLAVLDTMLLLIVSPVVAFYLLMDWDRMIGKIDALVPREHVKIVRDLASQVDRVLSGFVRGQLTVCTILGAFYAVALAMIGLQFGVVVGLFAGLISFIPFVGSILGGTLSVGAALFQFWGEWHWIIAVAAVFGIGQAVEGNVLTPKLVGDSVGLHPVWLIFALSAFGALLGFSGLLIAVPVAAVIGVMGRFLIGQYRDSRLYRGPEDEEPASQDAAE